MIFLALETSGDAPGVAVYDGVKPKAVCQPAPGKIHADALFSLIQKALKVSKTGIAKVGCVAVGLGPGSFTGLRIGVSAANLLAYALKARLVALCSLEIIARGENRDGIFAVLADARKGQVYAAAYERKKGKWRTLKKPQIAMRDEFLRSWRPGSMTVLEGRRPDVGVLAAAAVERAAAGCYEDPFSLLPLYLHPKDCNVTKK